MTSTPPDIRTVIDRFNEAFQSHRPQLLAGAKVVEARGYVKQAGPMEAR